jgi:hypothetical protein
MQRRNHARLDNSRSGRFFQSPAVWSTTPARSGKPSWPPWRSGPAVYNAIVWQDRRTSPYCAKLRAAGHEAFITERTGLLLDPDFSATKIIWILDNVEDARAQAERGELAFCAIDSFLIWCLTLDCAAEFGVTAPEHFAAVIPILGVAGDQQAALIGQPFFQPGMTNRLSEPAVYGPARAPLRLKGRYSRWARPFNGWRTGSVLSPAPPSPTRSPPAPIPPNVCILSQSSRDWAPPY